MKHRASVLIVDDEALMRIPLSDSLTAEGYEVYQAASGEDALRALATRSFDIAVIDLRLPGIDGLELIKKMRADACGADTIVMTAYGTVASAVEAMKLGARDFLTKPFETEALLELVDRYVRVRCVHSRQQEPPEPTESSFGMVGRSTAMRRVFSMIDAVATTTGNILIIGETGTGKELIANAIHARSGRQGALVKVNCAAIPETLVESELFGHERGAYTGADRRRVGRFELATGGSLFLDEVDEMPLRPQAKVLRVIQEGEIERLGGTATIRVDTRLIAATKTDLLARVEQGAFREDLFYRLNVLPIKVPPLRERGDDVALLAEHFLHLISTEYGRQAQSFSRAAMAWIKSYPFPGNVRELRNLVARAVTFCPGDRVELEHLDAGSSQAAPGGKLSDARRDAEDRRIDKALEATGGSKAQAAQLLGISRKTLWEKLSRRSK